jgi:hypothetical protein
MHALARHSSLPLDVPLAAHLDLTCILGVKNACLYDMDCQTGELSPTLRAYLDPII